MSANDGPDESVSGLTPEEAREFHRRVFAKWGNRCYFCGGKATDAMHIIPRSQLGPHRYACAEENGRPGCRVHHDASEANDPRCQFHVSQRRKAVKALNKILKQPIQEPV